MDIKIKRGQRVDVAKLLQFTAYGLLLTVFLGCGKSITGSNAELDVVHTGGPDCTQSGCHPGFGAGGTVFESAAGTTPTSGITVKARSVETGTEITLGITDTLGNFHYDQELNGFYNMAIGIGSEDWSDQHKLPDWKGCNRCHTWGASGRLYPKS